MAFAFFRSASPYAADDRVGAAAMMGHQAISAPVKPTDTPQDPWHFDQERDIWPLGIRLSLLGVLSLASWGLVIGAGYALRAVMA